MDRRKRAFKANMKEIEEHNKIYKQGQSTFVMGTNELADMVSLMNVLRSGGQCGRKKFGQKYGVSLNCVLKPYLNQ